MEKRLTVVEDEGVQGSLQNQRAWILFEMGKVLVDVHKKERPAIFLKYKQYDQDVDGDKDPSFIGALQDLVHHNHTLWDLEDIRRDKSQTDSCRLEAADRVSKHNKLRNEAIDQIDLIIGAGVDI